MTSMDLLSFEMPIAGLANSFSDSTFPGQMIVAILFFGSAWAWTIMLTKYYQLRCADRATAAMLAEFRSERSPVALYARDVRFPGSPLSVIYAEGCEALGREMQVQGVDSEELLGDELSGQALHCLNPSQLETLRAVVDRNVADEALGLEDQMGLLATAVSAAPFLGLLGTVWGVMDAFSGMAESGSAALSAVAPGISGALLTTIVGLLVALPSMIGYNLLSSRIRRLSVEMDNFAQEFVTALQNAYVRER